MNPTNFLQIWDILKPLMNPRLDPNILEENKQALLNLVVLKDNIDEALWYIYSGILITSIVYYNLATRGCVKSIEQIKQEHDSYIKEQELVEQQNKLNNSTTYKM